MDPLPTYPVVTIPNVAKLLETTQPTAGKAVRLYATRILDQAARFRHLPTIIRTDECP